MSGEFKKAYDYRDSDGNLIYQVCRFEPKRFSQRRPNPAFNPKNAREAGVNEEFIYNMEGVMRTIYKLPELLSAMKKNPDRWVFVVEGEKSVDLCWQNGIVATCNSGGALKWEEKFGGFLEGFRVAIIPDNDPIDSKVGFSPGRRHAEEVAASCFGKAKLIKILEMPGVPPKGDFDDWWKAFDESNTPTSERKAKLGELLQNTPEWKPPQKQAEASLEKQAEKTKEVVKTAIDHFDKAEDFLEFSAFYDKNYAKMASASSSEWLGNFYANRLALEKLYAESGSYEAVKEIVFLMSAQLLAGLPVARK